MLNGRDNLVETQSRSYSAFEPCKELTVDFTELLNISTISRIVVDSCSDDFESIIYKGP
jgi:hypothetical protein